MCNDKWPEQSLAWVQGSASIMVPRGHSQAGNMVGMSQGLLSVHIWMLFAKRFLPAGMCAGAKDSAQQQGWGIWGSRKGGLSQPKATWIRKKAGGRGGMRKEGAGAVAWIWNGQSRELGALGEEGVKHRLWPRHFR